MRHYSDSTRKKLSESGKKGMANRWKGHVHQTEEEYKAYQREYQRKYQRELYRRKKGLELAVDEVDSSLITMTNKVSNANSR